ncbi:lysine exporter LysO family protein [Advenella alkanexedens]|uniref:Lysine exporter LysO family protein n=1 Tax=Advenella alkanexedens TaxID=1481665 RepID=A0ABS6NLQ3_9BURK|nr:lysine exporter LysO family protein [Advenella alkanexedens]MBV4396568.1 lysine exporter LysO family protein [Advenella alkanexedens]
MKDLLLSLLPICLYLVLGLLIGKILPATQSARLARLITPFVWLLLFAIGYKFGLQLENLQNVTQILGIATAYALGTSVFSFAGLWLLLPKSQKSTTETTSDFGIWHVIRECGIAFAFLLAGIGLAKLLLMSHMNTELLPSVETLLYILLVLIGVDLVNAPISLKFLQFRIIATPVVVILFSLLGGAVVAWLMGMDIRNGLVLSAGFGWFSLSGVMVTARLGEFYGAASLMTDLFRELLSIVVLFFLGARHPVPAIGTSGATAMDTTLPIIKKITGNHYIATAIFSGAVLSLTAPFLLAWLLALFS